MKALDCNTKLGREWIQKQHRVMELFAASFDWKVIGTNDTRDGDIDALFFNDDDTLTIVAEVKCRNMSLGELRNFGSYLITFEKLNKGRNVAMAFRVPFILIVGLTDAVIFWQVSDDEGNWTAEFSIKQTRTQATCNGGETVRANAYLSLEQSTVLKQ